MTLAAHATAMLDRLQAGTAGTQIRVFDGAVPNGAAPPYVVVYFTADTIQPGDAPDKTVYEGHPDAIDLRAWVHAVGRNAGASREVAQWVRARLHNWQPSVAGRLCFPVRHESGQPPERDESTGVLVMAQVDVYRLTSMPA